MEKVNTMAEQSAWFRQYEAYVNGGKKASDGKKVILLIVPLLVIGGLIAMMIKNGALNNDQTKNGVYVLAGIGAFLFIMMLILISKTKKSNAAEITAKDLNELLKSPQDAADFDAQMQAAPLFQVVNSNDECIFGTRDYIGTRFKFRGNLTFRFMRIRDIEVLHIVYRNSGRRELEFLSGNNKEMLAWVIEDERRLEELKASLRNVNLELK